MTETFSEAAEHVARGEWVDAIAKLSAAWHAEPSARIGRLVAQLEERLGSPGPVHGERWLHVARSQDGSMLRALLAAPWPDSVRRACERVEALARWPRSPQIANALLALHRRELYADNTAQHHLTRAIFTVLVRYDDPATTEYTQEIQGAQAHGTASYAAYCIASALKGRPPPVEPVPPPEVEAALASMERAVCPPAAAVAMREALLQAVYDAPHDDAPRIVLADLLTSAGDPRGEFIQLQLQRHRGEARQEAIRREAALLRQAGNRWFDGLDRDAHGIRLERGFPAVATTWTCQFRAPAWATVEALEIEPLSRAVVFRGSPLLRGLRRLYGLDAAQLGHLSGELDVLTVRDFEGLDTPTELAPATLGIGSSDTDRSPDEHARYTAGVARTVASLAALPIGRRVRRLVLGLGINGLAFAVELAANPRIDEVVLHGSASRTLHEPVSWTAAISKRALHLRWCGEPNFYNPVDFSTIVTVLRELARPRFEELEIATSKRPSELAEVRERLRGIVGGWPRLATATLFGSRLRS